MVGKLDALEGSPYPDFVFWNQNHKKQEAATRDLVARKIKFDSSELENTLFSAGGGYIEKVKSEDVTNALRQFGHLRGKESAQVVGYLVPTGTEVLITVNGIVVDRLNKSAAKKTLAKISSPTPVKIEVCIIDYRDPSRDRPHIKIMRGSTPPKN